MFPVILKLARPSESETGRCKERGECEAADEQYLPNRERLVSRGTCSYSAVVSLFTFTIMH